MKFSSFLAVLIIGGSPVLAEVRPAVNFEEIEPFLNRYCFDCHADGTSKGDVSFDEFETDQELLADLGLWAEVDLHLQSHTMPPVGKSAPTNAERKKIRRWIDQKIFWVDPNDPDCVEQLEYYVNDLGLRGLKCSPIYQNRDPQDPRHLPLRLDHLRSIFGRSIRHWNHTRVVDTDQVGGSAALAFEEPGKE